MFISLEPHIAMPSDIQYIHLDEESKGIQLRKKWVFWYFFFLNLYSLDFNLIFETGKITCNSI